MYFIYRLYINDTTIYIGQTKNIKSRYTGHKSDCFIRKCNNKLYTSIRQLGITRDNFNDYVKYEILYENIPYNYIDFMERIIIENYKNNGCNLWNSNKNTSSPIIKCSACGKEISRKLFSKHINSVH